MNENMTVKELQNYCKLHKIKNFSKKNKKELLDLINEQVDKLLQIKEINNKKLTITNSQLNFIDLCSGIGGFHFGLKKHTCVLACDINKLCRESYKTNFNINCKADIFELNSKDLCDFDILCAGFPCQPFSKSGSRLGFRDKVRGTLFGEISTIIGVKMSVTDKSRPWVLSSTQVEVKVRSIKSID